MGQENIAPRGEHWSAVAEIRCWIEQTGMSTHGILARQDLDTSIAEQALVPQMRSGPDPQVAAARHHLVIHLTASGLRPGRYQILARADSDAVLTSQDLSTVDVGAEGTVDIEQAFPLEIGDEGTSTGNGVVVDHGPARCVDPKWSCKIAISLPEGTDLEPRILTPSLLSYPDPT